MNVALQERHLVAKATLVMGAGIGGLANAARCAVCLAMTLVCRVPLPSSDERFIPVQAVRSRNCHWRR